eukprot:8950220-Pyramimonas_sp.AAC.1
MPVPRVTLPFIRHGSERMRVSRLGLPRLIQTFGSTVPPERPLLHCVLQHIIDHGDSPGHRFWMGWQRCAKRRFFALQARIGIPSTATALGPNSTLTFLAADARAT